MGSQSETRNNTFNNNMMNKTTTTEQQHGMLGLVTPPRAEREETSCNQSKCQEKIVDEHVDDEQPNTTTPSKTMLSDELVPITPSLNSKPENKPDFSQEEEEEDSDEDDWFPDDMPEEERKREIQRIRDLIRRTEKLDHDVKELQACSREVFGLYDSMWGASYDDVLAGNCHVEPDPYSSISDPYAHYTHQYPILSGSTEQQSRPHKRAKRSRQST